MNTFEAYWSKALEKRKEQGTLRTLSLPGTGADFCSNDYLGLSANAGFRQMILKAVQNNAQYLTGATGSRLISGNSVIAESVEAFVATVHQAESALLFPSGYKANLALFSCIAGRHDTILVDELVHRSVHDGCLMAKPEKWKFRHNDMAHLEALLKKAKGNVLIAVESLYSMEGDFAPLKNITDLAKRYGAGVVVDEAHAIGVFGNGLVNKAGLQNDVLATVVTYGKAMGVQGAAVLGSSLLKAYLINFASPFIYSTAMPGVQVLSIRAAYEYLEANEQPALQLQERIGHFRQHQLSGISGEGSPIQIVQVPGAGRLREVVGRLKESGMLCYAVFPPTVPQGAERLRICLHAFNSNDDIDRLCTIIKKYGYE